MACVTACPSGVQYDKLIEATRRADRAEPPAHAGRPCVPRLIFALFPYPRRLRARGGSAGLYQRSGLHRLLRAQRAAGPAARRGCARMEALLPPVRLRRCRRRRRELVAARGTAARPGRAATGCVQRVFFAEVNAATVRVLAAEGCEVVVPPGQGCCGALSDARRREGGGAAPAPGG